MQRTCTHVCRRRVLTCCCCCPLPAALSCARACSSCGLLAASVFARQAVSPGLLAMVTAELPMNVVSTRQQGRLATTTQLLCASARARLAAAQRVQLGRQVLHTCNRLGRRCFCRCCSCGGWLLLATAPGGSALWAWCSCARRTQTAGRGLSATQRQSCKTCCIATRPAAARAAARAQAAAVSLRIRQLLAAAAPRRTSVPALLRPRWCCSRMRQLLMQARWRQPCHAAVTATRA